MPDYLISGWLRNDIRELFLRRTIYDAGGSIGAGRGFYMLSEVMILDGYMLGA